MLQNIAAAPDKNNRDHKNSAANIRPFRITWHGKSYAVTNIQNYHTALENGRTVHIFSATDGAGTFELKFSAEDVAWFLGA